MKIKLGCTFLVLICAQQALAQVPSAPSLGFSITGNSVEIDWTGVSNATGYRFFYAPFPNADPVESIDIFTTSISGELPLGSSFYIAVQAFNESGTSGFSNVGHFTISNENTTPSDNSCNSDNDDPLYAWPLAGINGKDWVVTNYVDLLSGPGMQDYKSLQGDIPRTRDGHNGTDISIPTFREMDKGVDIFAIHGGIVTEVIQNFPDRSTSCSSLDANVVVIKQDDGTHIQYGHIRTNSATVQVGQQVNKGDIVAQIGSSGCSFAPHLHLEVNKFGTIDPFKNKLWCDAPPYDHPSTIMHAILLEGPQSNYSDPYYDPPPNISQTKLGTDLFTILRLANGSPGDTAAVRMKDPDGVTKFFKEEIVKPEDSPLIGGLWELDSINSLGTWTVEYLANGEVQLVIPVQVVMQ